MDFVCEVNHHKDNQKDGTFSHKVLLSALPPKPPSLLPRLSLIASKLIQILEWETGIGVFIPLLDDFCIEKGSILKKDIGKRPFVPVFVAYVGVGFVKP